MLPLTGWAEFRKETFLDLISEDGEQWSDLFRIWNCVSMKVTGIPKYIGSEETNYGNIWVVGNIHESWWSLDYGREDTQITTSCSGRTLLSREKRHDYFKHSLPSGLEKREKSHRHHHSGCLLNFRIPDKFSKHTKLSPSWIRYGYLLPVTLVRVVTMFDL